MSFEDENDERREEHLRRAWAEEADTNPAISPAQALVNLVGDLPVRAKIYFNTPTETHICGVENSTTVRVNRRPCGKYETVHVRDVYDMSHPDPSQDTKYEGQTNNLAKRAYALADVSYTQSLSREKIRRLAL